MEKENWGWHTKINSLTHSSFFSRLGHKAAIKFRHPTLSWAVACTLPHVRPNSPSSFGHCSPPGGFWPASFPLPSWGPSQGDIGYPVTGHPWDMTKPSQPVVHTFRILIQFFISDLVVPVDIADHRPFSYFLSLLSSTQSHTQGEPYQRCNKAWS